MLSLKILGQPWKLFWISQHWLSDHFPDSFKQSNEVKWQAGKKKQRRGRRRSKRAKEKIGSKTNQFLFNLSQFFIITVNEKGKNKEKALVKRNNDKNLRPSNCCYQKETRELLIIFIESFPQRMKAKDEEEQGCDMMCPFLRKLQNS